MKPLISTCSLSTEFELVGTPCHNLDSTLATVSFVRFLFFFLMEQVICTEKDPKTLIDTKKEYI